MKRNYNKMSGEGAQKSIEINVQSEAIISPKEPKTFIVESKGKLNVRKSADKDGERICQLDSGDQIQVEDIDNGWAHVYTSSGIEGYVMAEFIKEG